MMMLDEMLAEFARHLGEQSGTRFSMDKALAHVVTMAYERGMADGRAQVEIDELRAVDDRLQHHIETTRLRMAAMSVLELWDTPAWQAAPNTAEFVTRLREALS